MHSNREGYPFTKDFMCEIEVWRLGLSTEISAPPTFINIHILYITNKHTMYTPYTAPLFLTGKQCNLLNTGQAQLVNDVIVPIAPTKKSIPLRELNVMVRRAKEMKIVEVAKELKKVAPIVKREYMGRFVG